MQLKFQIDIGFILFVLKIKNIQTNTHKSLYNSIHWCTDNLQFFRVHLLPPESSVSYAPLNSKPHLKRNHRKGAWYGASRIFRSSKRVEANPSKSHCKKHVRWWLVSTHLKDLCGASLSLIHHSSQMGRCFFSRWLFPSWWLVFFGNPIRNNMRKSNWNHFFPKVWGEH